MKSEELLLVRHSWVSKEKSVAFYLYFGIRINIYASYCLMY